MPYNYIEYVNAEVARRRTITIFDPELFFPSAYLIPAEEPDASLEKYPGVKVWTWESQGLIPTCSGYNNLIQGKDCGAPQGFVNVDFSSSIVPTKYSRILYVSLPPETPKIYSEVITGLQLDKSQAYQMNAVIRGGSAGSEWSETYSLFWLSSKLTGTKGKAKERLTEAFQAYGWDMIITIVILLFVWAVCLGSSLVLFLYASTCIDYMQNISKAFGEIDYIS